MSAYELVRLHTVTGNYAEAESLALKVIRIAKSDLSLAADEMTTNKERAVVLFLHSALADLYEATGRREECERLTKQVLDAHINSAVVILFRFTRNASTPFDATLRA